MCSAMANASRFGAEASASSLCRRTINNPSLATAIEPRMVERPTSASNASGVDALTVGTAVRSMNGTVIAAMTIPSKSTRRPIAAALASTALHPQIAESYNSAWGHGPPAVDFLDFSSDAAVRHRCESDRWDSRRAAPFQPTLDPGPKANRRHLICSPKRAPRLSLPMSVDPERALGAGQSRLPKQHEGLEG